MGKGKEEIPNTFVFFLRYTPENRAFTFLYLLDGNSEAILVWNAYGFLCRHYHISFSAPRLWQQQFDTHFTTTCEWHELSCGSACSGTTISGRLRWSSVMTKPVQMYQFWCMYHAKCNYICFEVEVPFTAVPWHAAHPPASTVHTSLAGSWLTFYEPILQHILHITRS
jgi:hypothetical protein